MSLALKRWAFVFLSSQPFLTLVLRCTSGRPQKPAVLTASGTTTRWLNLKMPFSPTALSYALFATRLAHARSMKSCDITGTGKSALLSLSSLPSYLTLNFQKQYETRRREQQAASTWHVENTTVRTQHAPR